MARLGVFPKPQLERGASGLNPKLVASQGLPVFPPAADMKKRGQKFRRPWPGLRCSQRCRSFSVTTRLPWRPCSQGHRPPPQRRPHLRCPHPGHLLQTNVVHKTWALKRDREAV